MTDAPQADSANTRVDPAVTQRLRQLNNAFRKTGEGGITTISMAVHAIGPKAVSEIRAAIAAFTGFDSSGSEESEHDYGTINYQGQMVYWKIDYFDEDVAFASSDATDPDVTVRVMTILLASDF